jgi:ATP-dependent Clp protease ATP-binding subunit ClpX
MTGGAFDGIEKKIGARLQTNMIGYTSNRERDQIDKDNLLQYVSSVDLKSYGLIPELVGRLPIVTHLHTLDRDTLRKILTEPRNSLTRQYVKLFEMDGIKLTFEENALDFIVDKSVEFKLGARGLRSIMEAVMTDAMFELPSKTSIKTLKLTLPFVEERFGRMNVARLKVA